MRKTAFLALIPFTAALFIGCGGGGGGGDSTDATTAGVTNGNASAGGSSGAGCTAATYTPNYVGDQGGLSGLQHWARFPVRYDVVRTANWSQERENQAVSGFNRWVTRTGGKVQLTRTGSSPQITVRFVPQSELGGKTIGLAESTWHIASHEMISVEISVATEQPDGTPMSASDIYATAMHEMGHALGIGVTGGHSPAEADIMFACSVCTPGEISQRDLNTLQTAYCGNFARGRATPPPSGGVMTSRVSCPHPGEP